MRPFQTVMLVCLVVLMLVWFLALLPGSTLLGTYSGWVPWLVALILAIMIFVPSSAFTKT